jgi:hypothetical protein
MMSQDNSGYEFPHPEFVTVLLAETCADRKATFRRSEIVAVMPIRAPFTPDCWGVYVRGFVDAFVVTENPLETKS